MFTCAMSVNVQATINAEYKILAAASIAFEYSMKIVALRTITEYSYNRISSCAL